MDIISHGLWGSAFLGTNKKQNFWPAFAFGMFPDLLAFSVPFITMIISLLSGDIGVFTNGRPHYIDSIPPYVHSFYNIGHSLVVFLLFFGIVWFIQKKPYIPMIAWSIHIILDIFTHGKEIFPTPFLWPLSDYKFDGMPWSSPYIFFPNIIALIVVYIVIFIYKRRKGKTA
jgi:hypothetical protein